MAGRALLCEGALQAADSSNASGFLVRAEHTAWVSSAWNSWLTSIPEWLKRHCFQEALCDCSGPVKSVLIGKFRIPWALPTRSPVGDVVCHSRLKNRGLICSHCLLSTKHRSWHIVVLRKSLLTD